MSNIILSHDLNSEIHSAIIGSKALQLAKLKNAGYTIPDFFVIPSTTIQKNGLSDKLRQQFRTIIKPQFIACNFQLNSLVVRSAALVEDGIEQSMAGQFMTRIDLEEHQIINSLIDLIQDAQNKLEGDLSKFSIIVQQYIAADISGVAFSRDPDGKRQMVINYHEGKGEDLVSGNVVPEIYEIYHYSKPKLIFAGIDDLVKDVKHIEELYGFPQDIERCIKNKKLYILQTRPITTLTINQYKTCKLIDAQVPHDTDFIYEKTEISEIAPRPNSETMALLYLIYAKNGPVDCVYHKYRIDYQDTNFLKLIQGELFIDRENEIKSLMPNYTYFGRKFGEPTLKWSWSIGTTFKNIWRLGRIGTNGYSDIYHRISESFGNIVGVNNYEQAKQQFLSQYELIFEINLITAKVLQNAKNMLSKESVSFVELMSNASSFITQDKVFDLQKIAGNLGNLGNTLDLDDTELFIPIDINMNRSEAVQNRANQLPTYKKSLYDKIVAKLGLWMHFRECARALMIKYKSELLRNQSQSEYLDYTKICYLPTKITSYIDIQTGSIGVSAGIAIGVITNIDEIENTSDYINQDPIILYVKNLSPNLTRYCEKNVIAGIISENGGLLSHMAIIARERGIPVIVTQDLIQVKNSNKQIEIDGSIGTFKLIDNHDKNG